MAITAVRHSKQVSFLLSETKKRPNPETGRPHWKNPNQASQKILLAGADGSVGVSGNKFSSSLSLERIATATVR